jgi:hypothetical protein
MEGTSEEVMGNKKSSEQVEETKIDPNLSP